MRSKCFDEGHNMQVLATSLVAAFLFSGCGGSEDVQDHDAEALSGQPAPLLVEADASISRIHMQWFTDQAAVCLEQAGMARLFRHSFQGYFLTHAKTYGTCLQTHVLFTGNVVDRQAVQFCDDDALVDDTALQRILKKYEASIDTVMWAEWLHANVPVTSDFSIVEVDGQSRQRSADPELFLDRVQEISSLQSHPVYEDLRPVFNNEKMLVRWEVAAEKENLIGRPLSVSRPQGFIGEKQVVKRVRETVSKSDLRTLIMAEQRFRVRIRQSVSEGMEAKFADAEFSASVIELAEVCDCELADAMCLDSCKERIMISVRNDAFLQDRFHVRKNEGTVHLNFARSADLLLSAYSTQLCAEVLSSPEPLIGLQGGNLITTTDIVFIGKDELNRYQHNASYRSRLAAGAAMDTSETAIRETLLTSVYADDTTGKHLIWLGTADKRDRYRQTDLGKRFHQPVYHIDLFMMPLGRHGAGDTLFMLFAMPDDASFFPESIRDETKAKHRYLVDGMQEVRQQLENDLDAIGKPFRIIEVPLWVTYSNGGSGNIIAYDNFINGLTDERNDTLRILYSVRQDWGMNEVYDARHTEFLRILADSLPTSLNLDTVAVIGQYGGVDGLRCQVKVLDRVH